MKKVYEADNSAEAHMIADMLEQGGIRTQVKGTHDPLMPASVWILNGNKYQAAMEIISALPPDEERRNGTRKGEETDRSQFQKGLLFGIAAVVVVFLVLVKIGKIEFVKNKWDADGDGVVDTWYVDMGGNYTVLKEDMNFDGRPDTWFHYQNGHLESSLEDTNFDGKPDVWRKYENGFKRVTVKSDLDFDGEVDRWDYYSSGKPVSYAADNDRDGNEDEWGYYTDAQLDKVKWSFKNDKVIDKVATYHNGRKISVRYDRDRDGRFDETIHYDEFERVVGRGR